MSVRQLKENKITKDGRSIMIASNPDGKGYLM